ncbi:hypothetical protein [Microcoleus sp. S13_D1]|uniref:hypothetical protein n=1 Tax=Microcoleus sp. S13_D1 TaxID=3055412 RepID=UPI002FD653D6
MRQEAGGRRQKERGRRKEAEGRSQKKEGARRSIFTNMRCSQSATPGFVSHSSRNTDAVDGRIVWTIHSANSQPAE